MYNFDKGANRLGTYCYKWDLDPKCIPMWVADMDFECAPKIKQAIIDRANIGAYGYSMLPDKLFTAYQNFWKDRHNFLIEKDAMVFSVGVVPSISSIVRSMTNKGDYVLIQSPVYNIFYNSIINNKRVVLSSDLVFDKTKNRWFIDFNDLEEKMSKYKPSLMILCNPHNPLGRIWTKEELEKIAMLAKKYKVLVLSDEIHCDITRNGLSYVPFASVSEDAKENSVTCIAPSKCFNMAGLNSSMVYSYNKDVLAKVSRGLNNDEIAENGFFAVEATCAAFNESRDWLDEMNAYVDKNIDYFCDRIEEELGIKICKPEATYLVWMNISKYANDSDEFYNFLKTKYHVLVSKGSVYGRVGTKYIRVNMACPMSQLIEATTLIINALKDYQNGAN